MVTIGIVMLVTSTAAASPKSTQKTILPMRRSGGCVGGAHVLMSGCVTVSHIRVLGQGPQFARHDLGRGRPKMHPPVPGKLLSNKSSTCERKIAELDHRPSRRNLLPASAACSVKVRREAVPQGPRELKTLDD